MTSSKVHEYQGYQVRISFSRSFPINKFSGGYVIVDSANMVVGQGQTPVVHNEALAEQLAFSLALEIIDTEIRKIRVSRRGMP